MKKKEWKYNLKRNDQFESRKSDNQRGSELMRQGRRIDIGAGGNSFHVDLKQGLWLGADEYNNAPFYTSMKGEIVAQRLTIDNFVAPTDASVTYTPPGSWVLVGDPTYPAAYTKYAWTVGQYFEIVFIGTSIGLCFATGSQMGKVKIYVDSILDSTVDLYSNPYIRKFVWTKTSLENVSHTIKCEIETANVLSTGNSVVFAGYSLFPNEGIKLQALSNIIYVYAANVVTDAQGYILGYVSVPAGYVVYNLISAQLSTKVVKHYIGASDLGTVWDITNPAGNTFRYTYASGTTAFFGALVAGVSTVTISGGTMNAGNLGTFTVDAIDIANTYFEITNAGGVVESGKTGKIRHDNPPDCPKIQWREDYYELYDGLATTTYPMQLTLMLSKL